MLVFREKMWERYLVSSVDINMKSVEKSWKVLKS